MKVVKPLYGSPVAPQPVANPFAEQPDYLPHVNKLIAVEQCQAQLGQR